MRLRVWALWLSSCGWAFLGGTGLAPKAMSSFQGEPQSLATIFRLVSQACESAIQGE